MSDALPRATGPVTLPDASRPVPGSPAFAVAFGGGGARGLSHIHVIEALDELGIVPAAIAGSSIGAIMGAGMAAGMRGVDIREHARSILGKSGEVAARMWRSRPGSIAEFVSNGIQLGQFDIERILRAFLPAGLPAAVEELEIPLQVVATDFFAHEQRVFERGNLIQALAASAAIPALFKPIREAGRILVDGGISNPVPFDLLEGRADIVVAIDVVGTPMAGDTKRPNSVDLVFGASQIMMQSIIALKLQRFHPQVMLRPPVSHFRVLDFMKVERLLSETASFKDEVKFAIHAAVERLDRSTERA